jgi:hypothetical protein
MSRVKSELTTPVLERVKTVHALDRAATVIGVGNNVETIKKNIKFLIGVSKEIGQKVNAEQTK